MREGPTNDLDVSFSDEIRSLKEDWLISEFVGMEDVEAVELERFSCDLVDLPDGGGREGILLLLLHIFS